MTKVNLLTGIRKFLFCLLLDNWTKKNTLRKILGELLHSFTLLLAIEKWTCANVMAFHATYRAIVESNRHTKSRMGFRHLHLEHDSIFKKSSCR